MTLQQTKGVPAAMAADAYQPRDVVNAPAVKAAIAARSVARGDDAEIAAWLLNHFYRWAIGCFDGVLALADAAQYRQLCGDAACPSWLLKKWQQGEPVFFLDPEHILLVERERQLCEFLLARRGTRLEHKLQRISCMQALALWEEEHLRMQKRRNKGWVPSSGLALRQVWRGETGTFFEFDAQSPHLREEMAYESFHMQHCLGQFQDRKRLRGGYGEQYASAAAAGKLRLFTLRSAGNTPHVTISVDCSKGTLTLDQLKGKQNRPPIHRYQADVLALLGLLGITPQSHHDCEAMGIVPAGPADARSGWETVFATPDETLRFNVLSRHPGLLAQQADTPLALQWLALSVRPYDPPATAGYAAVPQLTALLQAEEADAAASVLPAEWQDWLGGRGAPLQIDGIVLPALAAWREV
ncbi:hypothetical protein [Chitinilyticum litopenaei]|uniref:hypothetical protein n=1 Tax=Chitinilyticum litopenaei TaxID=1121276 RepID=UPI0003F88F80|nr:hypothetical protein [Chitinilyticum litopenaei]